MQVRWYQVTQRLPGLAPVTPPSKAKTALPPLHAFYRQKPRLEDWQYYGGCMGTGTESIHFFRLQLLLLLLGGWPQMVFFFSLRFFWGRIVNMESFSDLLTYVLSLDLNVHRFGHIENWIYSK